MSVDVSIELELFEMSDESLACEHQDHDAGWADHKDGNEHYIQIIAPCGHTAGGNLFIVCWQWILAARAYNKVQCPICGDVQPFGVANKIVGPVKDHLK